MRKYVMGSGMIGIFSEHSILTHYYKYIKYKEV